MVAYSELGLPQLLTLLGFLCFLQLGRRTAAYLTGAGLLGECAVGIIFGSQLSNILPPAWEEFGLALGYLGLVIILLEGGLVLNPVILLPNFPLAALSATVGIGLPIAFSFALFSSPAYALPKLSAFATGSALASTSLGTTFAVLDAVSKSRGLNLGQMRCGSILSGAALFDDVVSLALLAVLTSLGEGGSVGGASLAWLIVRPLLASAVMSVVGPLVALYLARPIWRSHVEPRLTLMSPVNQNLALLSTGVLVLAAFVTVATYVHTTVLLGSFLAGSFLRTLSSDRSPLSFLAAYGACVAPVQEHLFKPLFFASIGYSIPFTALWTGPRIWKGLIYALLMLLGKLLVGLVLIVAHLFSSRLAHQPPVTVIQLGSSQQTTDQEMVPPADDDSSELGLTHPVVRNRSRWNVAEALPPAALLGSAMVSRGEIGILVLQTVRSSEHPLLDEEGYLLGIWAVALCTIVGPISVSIIVKRWGATIAQGRWGGGQHTD